MELLSEQATIISTRSSDNTKFSICIQKAQRV